MNRNKKKCEFCNNVYIHAINCSFYEQNNIEEEKFDVIIFGIDPGSVNCGLCEYNATKNLVIKLERISFRNKISLDWNGNKKSEDTDIGNARIIENVVDYLNDARFKDKLVFIENQKGDNLEVLSVQYAFQTIFNKNCIPVAPHAIKACYSNYFPSKPGIENLSQNKRKEAQYRFDKTNAIKSGRIFVPKDVRLKYETENPDKKDDAYDAYWVARFASEYLLEISNNKTEIVHKKPKKDKKSVNLRPRIKKKRKISDSNSDQE